ncbi:MAG: gamma-glutamylcyclotransferase [Gammaproteobacteria bacterium]|nr:gamma-glutamylcyclotransferase [Gammaproteobacteria bacterium]
MHYFAYGSNMSIRRLRLRVPSARPCSVATLQGHELRFHKRGGDGSAKCDIHPAEDSLKSAIGVLFDIDPRDKPDLDRAEGLGVGYREVEVRLADPTGGLVRAFSYQAIELDPCLKPFDWYKRHVLLGAQENGLPPEYVALIAAVEAIADSDRERHARELAIYL